MIKNEKTLIILKPDVLQRNLVSVITQQLLTVGKIIYVDYKRPTREEILNHYKENLRNCSNDIKERVVDYMSSGMIILYILEGEDVINKTRKLIGCSDPSKSSLNTIRGKYGIDSYAKAILEERSCYNLIHGSDSKKSYKEEIIAWGINNKGVLG